VNGCERACCVPTKGSECLCAWVHGPGVVVCVCVRCAWLSSARS